MPQLLHPRASGGGILCFFPFPRGFALANKGGPEESVLPGKSPGPKDSSPELSEKHQAKARPAPASPSREDTGIVPVFRFIPLPPVSFWGCLRLSAHRPSLWGRGRGGQLLLPLSCLRERDPADSCAEANNSLTEGGTGAAHCGGRLSNPCARHGRRGKQAASGAAPVLPRGPGGPERGAARRFIFFRGRS